MNSLLTSAVLLLAICCTVSDLSANDIDAKTQLAIAATETVSSSSCYQPSGRNLCATASDRGHCWREENFATTDGQHG